MAVLEKMESFHPHTRSKERENEKRGKAIRYQSIPLVTYFF